MAFVRTFALVALLLAATVSAWAQSSEEDTLIGENRASEEYNPWGVSYFGSTNLTQRQLSDSVSDSLDVYNYVSFNYKNSRDTRWFVRPSFNVLSAGSNKYGDQLVASGKVGDTTLGYSNYNWFRIGKQKFSASVKGVLPTSDYAQKIRQIGSVKVEVFTDIFDEGRWSVSYGLKPQVYFNNETVMLDPNTKQYDDGSFMWDPRKTTKLFSLDHGVSANYWVKRKWEVGFFGGFSDDFYNSSVKEQLDAYHSTALTTSASVKWRPRYGFSVSASVSNYLRLTNVGGPLAYGRPEDNSVGIATNVSL